MKRAGDLCVCVFSVTPEKMKTYGLFSVAFRIDGGLGCVQASFEWVLPVAQTI